MDLRTAVDIWRKLAHSEARLHLLVELGYLQVGFPDVEQFCLELESKYRSTVTGELRDKGSKSPEWQIVKLCMKLKMIDERKVNAGLESERYNLRKKIEENFGKNTRRARNLVKNLRQEAARTKSFQMKKYEDKMKHLRKKYRTGEEEKVDKIPESIEDLKLENLSIFRKEKYEEKVVVEYEVDIIGNIELTDNERQILRLPPNFSIEENLPLEGMALDKEMAYAKARMTIAKEEEEKLDEGEDEGIEEDEEEQERQEKLESETRQVYDPRRRVFDDRKRRVTDLKECARITLPKPLDTEHEALIEMRRGTSERTYNTYRQEECNVKGEVRGNLTEEEKEGLRSLQKRMKSRELVILKTDKSGKLCVVSREEYLKMGEEHTGKDVEVERKTIVEKEKLLNGHVFFWCKIWGSGESHGHKGRIIDSKVVSSEQLADMYCMYKDHKEGRKSRPVVTGCNSNTRGFSNSVSDLLESVNKANTDPYESISSEDFLAKVNKYNKEAVEIMREGRERLHQKMMCNKEQGIKILSCCDKLWAKKSDPEGNPEEPEPGTGTGGGVEVPPVGGLVQQEGKERNSSGEQDARARTQTQRRPPLGKQGRQGTRKKKDLPWEKKTSTTVGKRKTWRY